MQKLDAVTLKEQLWETLHGIKEGNIDASNADAIASQAREILRTTKVQLNIISMAKEEISKELIDFAIVKP